jgi:uncharacterized protein YeaO (DUF488 family)
MIKLKRAYEEPSRQDGVRILVERLWPRGLSKHRAKIDLWLRTVAPSPELRKWFNHEPARWVQFQRRYRRELGAAGDVLALLNFIARKGPVTFVYAASDTAHNSARLLKEFLEQENR